jgi:hypothetical protein
VYAQGSPGVGFPTAATEILKLIAEYYGAELAKGLEEIARRLPGAMLQFLKDHPASDAQWNPTVNPAP